MDEPTWYEIRVRSHLDEELACSFAGLEPRYETADETILYGPLPDQAALHGVLMRIRDLGLTLLALEMINNQRATSNSKGVMMMSGRTLQLVIAAVFFIHGIGHVMCIMPALGMNVSDNWNSRSWLLTDLIGQTATNIVAIIIWGAAVIGFLLAALSLMGWVVPHEWWRTLAVVSAVISLIGIILFWNAFAAFFNKGGAIIVDLAVLIGLLVMHWPTEEMLMINSQ